MLPLILFRVKVDQLTVPLEMDVSKWLRLQRKPFSGLSRAWKLSLMHPWKLRAGICGPLWPTPIIWFEALTEVLLTPVCWHLCFPSQCCFLLPAGHGLNPLKPGARRSREHQVGYRTTQLRSHRRHRHPRLHRRGCHCPVLPPWTAPTSYHCWLPKPERDSTAVIICQRPVFVQAS